MSDLALRFEHVAVAVPPLVPSPDTTLPAPGSAENAFGRQPLHCSMYHAGIGNSTTIVCCKCGAVCSDSMSTTGSDVSRWYVPICPVCGASRFAEPTGIQLRKETLEVKHEPMPRLMRECWNKEDQAARCMLCGTEVQPRYWLCTFCANDFGVAGVPSVRWPEWMKQVEKLERKMRKHAGRYAVDWQSDEAPDCIWDGDMVGYLRATPFCRPKDITAYQKANKVVRILDGKRQMSRRPIQVDLSAHIVPCSEQESGVDDASSPDPLEYLVPSNETLSQRRKFPLASPPDSLGSRYVENQCLRRELFEEAQTWWSRLSPEDTWILALRLNGKTLREIGYVFGKSHQTIMRRLEDLREMIVQDCGYEPADLA